MPPTSKLTYELNNIYYKYIHQAEHVCMIEYSWSSNMNTAKLFKNGQSQAVRLPKNCRFMGDEVRIQKIGDAVLLTPIVTSWDPLLKSIQLFPNDLEFTLDDPDYKEEDLF